MKKQFGGVLADILLAILIAGTVFIGVQYFMDDTSVQTVSYRDFQSIPATHIRDFNVAEDGVTATYSYVANGNEIYAETVVPAGARAEAQRLAEAGVTDISVAVPSQGMGVFSMVILSCIPVLLLIGFLIYQGKKMAGGPSKSKFRKVDPKDATTRLSDVVTTDGELSEVADIVDFLKDPVKYKDAKAKMPRGILMAGPPGVGKTLMAKAIAGEAGVPFFEVSGSEFIEMYVGLGASRIRELFAEARKEETAIIFIDEIDAIGKARTNGAGGGNREADQTINQLLTEMQGFDDKSNIIVIGATNRVDTLDPALVRPGRFDRTVDVSLPDIDAREKILNIHLGKINLCSTVTSDNIRTIARGTPGFSGAELSKIVNEAAIAVGKAKRTEITYDDLELSKDKVIMGEESAKKMSEKELECTAYHEAGHAIVGYLSPEHDPVYKVSIVPRGRALGVTMYLPEEDRHSHSKTSLSSMLASLYGGRVAEEIIYGEENVTSGASSDIERASSIARSMVTKWGFGTVGAINMAVNDSIGNPVVSQTTLEQVDKDVRNLSTRSYETARTILTENLDKLHTMARLLLEKETIDKDDIDRIMEGGE